MTISIRGTSDLEYSDGQFNYSDLLNSTYRDIILLVISQSIKHTLARGSDNNFKGGLQERYLTLSAT